MERANRRTEIGQAVLKKGLSAEGRDWFTLAMDPFHDYQHPVAGFPDADSSHTVVSCFQYALDVSKPAGSAGNWDCHIFTNPVCEATLMPNQITNVANVQYSVFAGALSAMVAPVSIIKADAGQDLFPKSTVNWNPTNIEQQAVDMTPDAGAGVSRIIGMGFEVVNTTADMYRQGALTAYRMPQEAAVDYNMYCNSGVTIGSQIPVRTYRSPPSTANDAMVLGGTRQWAAAEGAYVVSPLATVQNPLTPPSSINMHYSVAGTDPAGAYVVADQFAALGVTSNLPVLTAQQMKLRKYTPYCTTGVFLTGLSQQTTLRIKVKCYVERAPTFNESSLAVLATPSAPYDAKVLNLYSSVLTALPVAVPVGYNAAGDWWKMILKTVAAVAAPIGGLMGGPAGGLIGAALAGGAGLAAGVIPETAKFRAKERQFMDVIDTSLTSLKKTNSLGADQQLARLKQVAANMSALAIKNKKKKKVSPAPSNGQKRKTKKMQNAFASFGGGGPRVPSL